MMVGVGVGLTDDTGLMDGEAFELETGDVPGDCRMTPRDTEGFAVTPGRENGEELSRNPRNTITIKRIMIMARKIIVFLFMD